MRLNSLLAYLLLFVTGILSGQSDLQASPKAGEEYKILVSYEIQIESDNGSSGSASGQNTYLERIFSAEDGELLREFDLAVDEGEERTLAHWQFPVRILSNNDGYREIANRAELEARRDAWLVAAKIPKESCGKGYFTWSYFEVECDPDDIFETIGDIDITRAIYRDGAEIEFPGTMAPARLHRLPDVGGKQVYEAKFAIDPEQIRNNRADSDVSLARLRGEVLTLEDARAEQAKVDYSGEIEVTYEIHPSGDYMRRTAETKMQSIFVDGSKETEKYKDVVERERVQQKGPDATGESDPS